MPLACRDTTKEWNKTPHRYSLPTFVWSEPLHSFNWPSCTKYDWSEESRFQRAALHYGFCISLAMDQRGGCTGEARFCCQQGRRKRALGTRCSESLHPLWLTSCSLYSNGKVFAYKGVRNTEIWRSPNSFVILILINRFIQKMAWRIEMEASLIWRLKTRSFPFTLTVRLVVDVMWSSLICTWARSLPKHIN